MVNNYIEEIDEIIKSGNKKDKNIIEKSKSKSKSREKKYEHEKEKKK